MVIDHYKSDDRAFNISIMSGLVVAGFILFGDILTLFLIILTKIANKEDFPIESITLVSKMVILSIIVLLGILQYIHYNKNQRLR